MRILPPKKTYPAFVMLLAALLSQAYGAVLVEDQFLTGANSAAGEYNLGAVVGQGPSNTGYTGSYLNAGFSSAEVVSAGLSYTNGTHFMQTSGGALRSTAAVQHTRVGRLLDSPFDSSSNEVVYLNFLYQISTTTGYKALELHNGGFADVANRVLQIGSLAGDGLNAGNFGLRINNNNTLRLDLGALNTNVNLFVLKFTFSDVAGGDSVTVYFNPALNLEPEPVFVLSGFDLHFDRTSLAKFNGTGSALTLDEIRFGESFNDVTTIPAMVPEPSAFAALLGVASLFGCLCRRRRR